MRYAFVRSDPWGTKCSFMLGVCWWHDCAPGAQKTFLNGQLLNMALADREAKWWSRPVYPTKSKYNIGGLLFRLDSTFASLLVLNCELGMNLQALASNLPTPTTKETLSTYLEYEYV